MTRLRLRRSGPEVFADVTLAVGRGAAFERAHDIAHEVETAVAAVAARRRRGGPRRAGRRRKREDVTTVVRLLAARHGLGAHGIRIYEENRQRWLELHLEVSDSLLLDEAHRQATEFERALRKSLPGVTRIVTHIEPAGDAAATVRGEPAGQSQVQAAIDGISGRLSAHRSSRTIFGCRWRRRVGRFLPLHASIRRPPSPRPTS